MNRAVHIFPPDHVAAYIEPLRQKYDPLYSLIGPHMTLVFPFESDLSMVDLEEHIKRVLTGVSPFKVVLQGITGTDDGYLFLNVKMGNDEIISLHDRLYTGPLQSFLNRRATFFPHLTVGKLLSKKTFETALEETTGFTDMFSFEVGAVAVEEIQPNGKSIILFKVSLDS